MAEYLEVFTEHNEPTGLTKLRSQVHTDGDWHRTTQIYILNQQRQVLCNLRSAHKEVFPSLWDLSIGGHLEPGESYIQAAVRELNEELGLDIQSRQLTSVAYLKIDGKDEVNGLLDREHAMLFLYQTDLPLADLVYPLDEIAQLHFFPLEYLKAHLRTPHPDLPIIPLYEKFLVSLEMVEQKLA